MLIDWFTVIAQILNFLVLVWLLKRYLYKPILNAIDKREKLIASQLEDAANVKVEAKNEQAVFQKKNFDFDRQRDALFNQVKKEAEVEKGKLMGEAHKEYEALRSRLRESLQIEHASIEREIIRRTQSEVFAITRKTLVDLASESLEERMVEVFIGRLKGLKSDEMERLVSSDPALLRTAFELPETLRNNIEKAIKEKLNQEMQIEYEITPDLVSGIELTVNGNKIAWSIADYLALQKVSINDFLDRKEQLDQGDDKSAT